MEVEVDSVNKRSSSCSCEGAEAGTTWSLSLTRPRDTGNGFVHQAAGGICSRAGMEGLTDWN